MATRQQRISDARSCAEMAQRMPPQGGLVCLPALNNSRLYVSSGGVIAYGVGLQTPMGRGLQWYNGSSYEAISCVGLD
jgi:hypothetical protein